MFHEEIIRTKQASHGCTIMITKLTWDADIWSTAEIKTYRVFIKDYSSNICHKYSMRRTNSLLKANLIFIDLCK